MSCLSQFGPPPHCGHVPTPDAPICVVCLEASHNYYCKEEERIVRDAKRVLESRGYTVTRKEAP
jgi:hypothetical protein